MVTERHEPQPLAALNGMLGDPVALFGKLDAELRAADALIRLSATPAEQRRAALDGLQLARDVLADALDVLDVVDDERTRREEHPMLDGSTIVVTVPDVTTPEAELQTFTGGRHSCACGEVDELPGGEPVDDAAGRMHDGIVCSWTDPEGER